MLHYRFKHFFVQAQHTSYHDQNVIPFSIDWNEYVNLNNAPVKAQNQKGKSYFIHDIDGFLASIPTHRAEWSVDAMLDSTVEALCMKNSRDNVKIGEDIGTQTPDIPNTIEHILAEPLNL